MRAYPRDGTPRANASAGAPGSRAESRDCNQKTLHARVLKYFVEVARCGSIRKAAQNLYVASSAVNRQILKLEAEMGTDLFDRLPNGIRLNAAGERMLQHIRATLNDFHLMRGELDELKDERTGQRSSQRWIRCSSTCCPRLSRSSRDKYPAVTYAITAVTPWDVASKVLSGEYDVGITFISKRCRPRRDDPGALPPGVVMASRIRWPGRTS